MIKDIQQNSTYLKLSPEEVKRWDTSGKLKELFRIQSVQPGTGEMTIAFENIDKGADDLRIFEELAKELKFIITPLER